MGRYFNILLQNTRGKFICWHLCIVRFIQHFFNRTMTVTLQKNYSPFLTSCDIEIRWGVMLFASLDWPSMLYALSWCVTHKCSVFRNFILDASTEFVMCILTLRRAWVYGKISKIILEISPSSLTWLEYFTYLRFLYWNTNLYVQYYLRYPAFWILKKFYTRCVLAERIYSMMLRYSVPERNMISVLGIRSIFLSIFDYLELPALSQSLSKIREQSCIS